MENKVFSFLGLAQRSGNLVTGEDTCKYHIKKNDIELVVVAEDASDHTKKKFSDMSNHRNIKFIIYGKRENLSHAVGKVNRTVYGIKDERIANKIFFLMNQDKDGPNNLGGE
ncbi:ribosomal L7Ae/L30e/S12e/Gadd45 family protein [Clostridiaceae bacterium 35-E11]